VFTRPKEKIEKKKNSSHKLPKQQSTSFWSQGILGVKIHQVYGDVEVDTVFLLLKENMALFV
jgi:hypothetical protein